MVADDDCCGEDSTGDKDDGFADTFSFEILFCTCEDDDNPKISPSMIRSLHARFPEAHCRSFRLEHHTSLAIVWVIICIILFHLSVASLLDFLLRFGILG